MITLLAKYCHSCYDEYTCLFQSCESVSQPALINSCWKDAIGFPWSWSSNQIGKKNKIESNYLIFFRYNSKKVDNLCLNHSSLIKPSLALLQPIWNSSFRRFIFYKGMPKIGKTGVWILSTQNQKVTASCVHQNSSSLNISNN